MGDTFRDNMSTASTATVSQISEDGTMARLKGFLSTMSGKKRRGSTSSSISSYSNNASPTGSLSGVLIQRRQTARTRLRIVAFVCSMISCLSAGSFLIFSIYAPLLQTKLHYSQLEVNAVAIAGELGQYLPVPIFGYLCDKYGPAQLSLISIGLFTPGYLLASSAFHHRLPYTSMLVAFLLIGGGTSSMYLSGVATCAKNFTKRRGLALALPIAAFGLSSLWMSQVANEFFYVRDFNSDGTKKPPPANLFDREIDVSRLFVFFAFLLLGVGVVGFFGLRIIPEGDEDKVILHGETAPLLGDRNSDDGYGATGSDTTETDPQDDSHHFINTETRAFLKDPTMWLFAAGFFLITGPGEAFLANMGTLLHSINTKSDTQNSISVNQIRTDPAFHVGIIAFTSTVARILSGLLSDYLAPQAEQAPASPVLPRGNINNNNNKPKEPFQISRITLITVSAGLMLVAHIPLSLGFFQSHPSYFWIVSAAIGWGYGAVFCLAPNVVSCIWGTENFGTNWGAVTMMPAGGATVFGILFAKVYDNEGERQHNAVCWGLKCYRDTFIVMGASVCFAIVFWLLAWKGKNGWKKRGIAV